MIVIVTIHGIGFQNAPSTLDADDGYADPLHAGLSRVSQLAGGALGDDPNRLAAGGRGPVYVASSFPPETNNSEDGLRRLGTWVGNQVDPTGMPLAPDNARFAHVALVYSHLEEAHGDAVATVGLGVLGAPSLTHYATIGGIARLAFEDLRVIAAAPGQPTPSQRLRPNAPQHRGFFSKLIHGRNPPGMSGPLATLRQVEDDVAAYVVRNEHRERVRAFIRDAVSSNPCPTRRRWCDRQQSQQRYCYGLRPDRSHVAALRETSASLDHRRLPASKVRRLHGLGY